MQLSDKVTAPDLNLRPHEQISGYGLIKRRGRGGVAEVWEADSPAGYLVALKLVPLSTDLRSSELRALKITRGIRHPSLLEIFGTWQVENLLVICMELADRSLWDRFLEVSAQGLRGVPRSELLGYLKSVADAIDYLNDYKHSVAGRDGVGVQHRDLKPQNILLLGGQAKVADFGLARVMEQAVASHTGPCTLPYAAPEYFGGKTSRQSDQYALAVTYCQLRGGWMPFHGSTAQITFGHLYNDPDLGSLPAPERPIVARALAKRPEERWPDCRSFIDALQALESEPGWTVPDLLPRDPCDIAPDQHDRDGSPNLSLLTDNSADSDFIPVDPDELEAAGYRSRRAEPGSLGSTREPRLDRPAAARGFPRGWMKGELPARDVAARLAALVGELGTKFAHLVSQAIALAASGMTTLLRGTRSLTARLGLGTATLLAALRPRLAHLVGLVAALTVLGMTILVVGTRSLASRLRNGATALTAEFRPRLARPIGQVTAVTKRGMTTLIRGTRSLATHLYLDAAASGAIAWSARRVPKFSRVDPVVALLALGLVTIVCGAWIEFGRSYPAPLSTREAASGTAARTPDSRGQSSAGTAVAAGLHQGKAADATAVSADPGKSAPRSTPDGGDAPEHRPARLEETTTTTLTSAGPTPEARTSPRTPDEAVPDPVVRKTIAAGTEKKDRDSVAGSSDPSGTTPRPAVESPPSPANESDGLSIGSASTAVAPANPSTGPVAGVSLLRFPKLIQPISIPAVSVPERLEPERESTRDALPAERDPKPSHSTAAGDAAAKPSAPSLTLPTTVTVAAGETTKVPANVERGDTSKPTVLELFGLSRGTTAGNPTMPTGQEKTEVVLSASAGTSPGSVDVVDIVKAGSQQGEASMKLTVLPPPARLACEQGRADLRRGAYAQAIISYSEGIRLDPESFEAHFHRGVAYDLEGRPREALADFTFAIRVAPGSAEARAFRARVHHKLGQYQLALEDFSEAIRIRPDANAYVARGRLLHEIGSYDQALADYESALRLRPDDPAALYRRGVTRYVMGDNVGAILDFTEAIRHDPKHASAYSYRSDAFARLGEFSKASSDHDMFERLSHPSVDGKGVLK